MQKTVVIDIVGLSESILGQYTPFLDGYIAGKKKSKIKPPFPAVTTTSQSVYLTGKYPNSHGIVGNGWYDEVDSEVKFWKQSNKLVGDEKIWDAGHKKDSNFTCANLFWWYNMYSSADYSVTPRPQYHSDGVKMPDCYSHPAVLRDELQEAFGTFPLFNFWGPNANIKSTNWIADASIYVDKKYDATLTFIYLPHLDYCLQKFGVDFEKIKGELHEIDQVVERLIAHFESAGAKVIILSEYGINNVSKPIHVNRILREAGYIALREEQGLELLDPGASRAFAVSDHQIAHVYCPDATVLDEVKLLLKQTKGIHTVLSGDELAAFHIDHPRAGDLVLIADNDAWFTYYYWLDDNKAPDFARCVDIFKKPGYDPVEMFMDPKNPFIKLRAAYKLARKLTGFRYRMDVIPLDATLVKGSHGSPFCNEAYYPLYIADNQSTDNMEPTEVYSLIWNTVFK
ncbi:alkaline phosphatase family protein [Aquirufa sp. LEPPI-3A]|uniref:alkaline phosphatase family protein n=1 Tax=Aquirufa regiilacus TaxID=3024868 RepID=UPI0028E0024F|nr:alkaline phosphatase family protein [Aquirufa sp. LEPPI-3A]MDT8888268.1 alkaline phosphatase family protein [Aquirufa sp. LEPPI-3A]